MLKTCLIYGAFAMVLVMTFYGTWVGAGKEEEEEAEKKKAQRADLRRKRQDNYI